MEDSIGKISVCIHGGLRHKCETCDLADRLEAAEASLTDCSKEYHAAINEPEYAGTRQDWIWRAQAAEARVQELVGQIAQLEHEMRLYAAESYELGIEWADRLAAILGDS